MILIYLIQFPVLLLISVALLNIYKRILKKKKKYYLQIISQTTPYETSISPCLYSILYFVLFKVTLNYYSKNCGTAFLNIDCQL